MVQNVTWEWLLEGFKFDLEIEVKPKTVEYYCDHARVFIRWIQQHTGVTDPHVLTKRDVQEFLHHLTQESARVVAGNGAIHLVKRTATTRWHYYLALKRFFRWAVQERYMDTSPLDGITIKAPKSVPLNPTGQSTLSR